MGLYNKTGVEKERKIPLITVQTANIFHRKHEQAKIFNSSVVSGFAGSVISYYWMHQNILRIWWLPLYSWVGMNQVFKIGDFKSIRCHRDVKFRYRAWNWPSQLLRKRNLVDPSSKYNLRKTGHWCHHCPIQIFDGGHFQQFMNERKQIYEWAWRHTWRLSLWRGHDVATTYRHPGLRSGNDGIRQDGLTLAHPWCLVSRAKIWPDTEWVSSNYDHYCQLASFEDYKDVLLNRLQVFYLRISLLHRT